MCKKYRTFAQNFENCAMSSNISFNKYIYDAIINNWDADALTDFQGQTLQFHDVARKIEKLHIVFENCGIEKGDKIAICGRNSAHWAVTFLATLTYGAVVVPILHEFNAEQIHNIVNHSGAKALFVGDFVAKEIDPEQMPALEGIVFLPDFSLMVSRSEKLTYAREHLNMMFGEKYPKAFRKELKDTMLEYGVKTFRTPNGILITRVDDTPSSVKVTEELDLDLLRSQMPELFKPVSEGGYLVKKSSKVACKAGHVKVTFPKEK